MKNKLISILATCSLVAFAADNEIYVDQSGTGANIDLEQLGISISLAVLIQQQVV